MEKERSRSSAGKDGEGREKRAKGGERGRGRFLGAEAGTELTEY